MKQDFRSFFVLTIQCLRWVILLPLAIIASPLATNAQDTSLESDLMECIRSSFSNREGLLDSLMTTFESELVAEGLMESRDSEEYRGLLQRIASDQPILRGMDSYFLVFNSLDRSFNWSLISSICCGSRVVVKFTV